ncbi:hypothetical protein CA267_015300 [Alteromonas pelagimontana]|uniref:Phosphate ABC transporter substrate-binding protein n=1 Tax=Alteromonas pelagimontana TaxID=1858656 RepID=A0A6M4MG27_9ALTE|nr:hypothetical protein [Alteromonas pelagimontana]QJR82022.1 hypothetical protein CA267_015300 [Alteromonas pelagimontana]
MSWHKLLIVMLVIAAIGATRVVAGTELVVVVHKNNPTIVLSKSQLIDMFMGKFVAFPNGAPAVPVDIGGNAGAREEFYRELVGMPLARVNAYWSRVKFSGKARPPSEYKDEQAILDFVSRTENGIAYVSKQSITPSVKVVYSFDE